MMFDTQPWSLKKQFTKITEITPSSRLINGSIIAALDLGSNSFHLVVVKAHSDTSFEVLLKEKSMIRLGDVVSKLGYIDDSHLSEVIDSIRSFRALAESLGATEMVALATSAFRDAENSSEVVDLIEEETGVSVSVISGHKEAELIYKAVSSSVTFPDQIEMCADLGGGSLEIIIGSQSELLWSQSLNLGVGRLTAAFVTDTDSLSNNEMQKMRKHVKDTLSPLRQKVEHFAPGSLICSSGSFLSLARMALLTKNPEIDPGTVDDLNQVSVTRSALRVVNKLILKSDTKTRSTILGLDPKRIDIIPAAAVVLEELMSMFGFKKIILSEWALREGIILSELDGYDSLQDSDESIRTASVMGMTKRFMWNSTHAEQVVDLALSLFDQTQSIHGMSRNDRELLHYGALLHDIGEHIAMEDHDKHSAYLIENSRLRGFSPSEKKALTCIGRFHRRGAPKIDFGPFGQLDDEWQNTVIKLVSILRIADALDRSHESVVNRVEVVIDADRVTIHPHARGEFELEAFGLRRKRSLFEQTFGVKVTIAPK